MTQLDPMAPPKPKFSFIAWGFWSLFVIGAAASIYRYADPAPPKKLVISTGEGEGNYESYAKAYQTLMKLDGVNLDVRQSSGAWENLERLKDPKSDVEVGFVHDGLGNPDDAPDLVSLGSMYYEPIWIFYRANKKISRLIETKGKRFAVGPLGGGTRRLVEAILNANGINKTNTKLTDDGWDDAAKALRANRVDVIALIGTPDEELIVQLVKDKSIQLMNMDQADAIARQFPYLHHLTLPHGAIDLATNSPAEDINLISPTATLIARNDVHPALIYLLLKTASEIHNEPGVFEKKNEFPSDTDYQFPLSDDAKEFYKSGTPFWHRFLPFWLATIVQRFIFLVLPTMAILLPVLRLIPRMRQWRIKSKIYRRYGELKFLEMQIHPKTSKDHLDEFLKRLDRIEEQVKNMKVPLEYTEHLYGLRGHIDFVRARIHSAQG